MDSDILFDERTLPRYVRHDIEAFVKGEREGSHLLDCLWCELYGSINSAEVDRLISPEFATHLRDKYLWGTKR
ncbi:MAG: hypothetical protein Q4Q17_04455 [Tissierellia bacterium]|nr:hypothetical protein [Tissierellia bacterium]